MEIQELALKTQKDILALECDIAQLLCHFCDETTKESFEVMTCLQDTKVLLDDAHTCLVKAAKAAGVTVKGGGGGRLTALAA